MVPIEPRPNPGPAQLTHGGHITMKHEKKNKTEDESGVCAVLLGAGVVNECLLRRLGLGGIGEFD